MTPEAMPPELTVYFNGACNICAPEVELYRRRTQAHGRTNISYCDISSAEMPTDAPDGKSRDDMLARLHIQKNDIWYSGVDAFIHLWAEVPGFNWLARLVALPPVRAIAVSVYDHVLAPWLYRRHVRRAACAVS
jgi:predicted DCC family thiol-disulfide oxidoreductase YuxK